MNVNLEYYKVFYYVARTGSLTLAAEMLSVSQPAVSQAMKQLESTLDVKLFDRTKKGVKLTQEGNVLFSHIEKGYEQILLGEKKLKQMQNLEIGEIRIGASDMTLQFFLLPFLEKFHEKFPGIRVNVTNAPTPETIKNLKEDRIDFGIVSTPLDTTQVQLIPVMEIQDTFVAGRRFLPYKNRMLDFSILEELPMICLEGNTSTNKFVNEFLEKNHVRIHPEFELPTSDMIVQFALRSLGVGCVVKNFAQEFIDNGTLFELRFTQKIPSRQICLVKPLKGEISGTAKALYQMIEEELHLGI